MIYKKLCVGWCRGCAGQVQRRVTSKAWNYRGSDCILAPKELKISMFGKREKAVSAEQRSKGKDYHHVFQDNKVIKDSE